MGLAALKIEDLPHYTYDDYAQWEGQWEIIKGIPYAMVPAPVPKHQRLSLKIAAQLDALLSNCSECTTYQTIDWQLEDDTVVQPDVLVVCGDHIDGKKLTSPPVLVIEILSPSTSRKDRILKYQLYEQAGVKYYCLVSPETDSAEVFHLGDNHYQESDDFKDGKISFLLGKCLIAFDFGKAFNEL
jgi:Uma2 family endonuclease